jgi:hypothetical protein
MFVFVLLYHKTSPRGSAIRPVFHLYVRTGEALYERTGGQLLLRHADHEPVHRGQVLGGEHPELLDLLGKWCVRGQLPFRRAWAYHRDTFMISARTAVA